jgi:hypothetical protein
MVFALSWVEWDSNPCPLDTQRLRQRQLKPAELRRHYMIITCSLAIYINGLAKNDDQSPAWIFDASRHAANFSCAHRPEMPATSPSSHTDAFSRTRNMSSPSSSSKNLAELWAVILVRSRLLTSFRFMSLMLGTILFRSVAFRNDYPFTTHNDFFSQPSRCRFTRL